MSRYIVIILLFLTLPVTAFAESARAVVEKSFHHMRGESSVGVVDMLIHRPDYERHFSLKAWSKGRDEGLFLIISPKMDKGNGTLKKGRRMWTYNPGINRVIKLPPSMMGQSWMGSDFSNNDLSKTESILDDYNHMIISHNKSVYTIESTPVEGAAVVWGKVEMKIRADGVLLKQKFFDQDMVAVKELTTSKIKKAGDRLFPMVWVMRNLEEEDRYTKMVYTDLSFNMKLSDNIFTTTNMKNGGE
ncbi:MAG: outer membrane lipoprotein-sorting protein [Denitrovibrio sp.]|nr:MAG: outer membrane lipoprotein-sorting protein [Denitrovibrio sp.]